MSAPIELLNVVKYYRELPHQVEALNWLQTKLSDELLAQFAVRYRNAPKPSTDAKLAHSALFYMPLGYKPTLQIGRFVLKNAEGANLCEVRATSGSPSYQQRQHLWTRARGPIPDLNGLRLDTQMHWSDTPGIEGEWFDILPVYLTNPNTKARRSYFGLHRDANAPGSAGCIVILNTSEFRNIVIPHLKYANQKGVQDIPLSIHYTGS